MSVDSQKTASFGFQDVPADDKARLVRGVFDRVASRYDLMNDLMSAGVHRVWKAAFISRLAPGPGETILDVAGGTGDIASAFISAADRRQSQKTQSAARAIICDINREMLVAGISRHDAKELSGRIRRICGDAEKLPLPDKCVDVVTIAFGIRNVTNIDAALREARRVLKIGGRFACLEFSHPITQGLQTAYDAYSYNVIPWLGEKVAGDRESYQYLVESIRRFPRQDTFLQMLKDAGFARAAYTNYTGGVAAIHSGWRL
ncbi:MAG: class I SAM-dependent methyltransferase [Parvularculaceae bacterium]|nr:class I SAM-dependent methyltransferase [Parvularculaceae bacterium]